MRRIPDHSVEKTPAMAKSSSVKWDAVLDDIEQRSEQVRQLKRFEGWRLVFTALGTGAALVGAGSIVGGLIVRILSGHG